MGRRLFAVALCVVLVGCIPRQPLHADAPSAANGAVAAGAGDGAAHASLPGEPARAGAPAADTPASADGDDPDDVDDGVEVEPGTSGSSAQSLVTLTDAELEGKLRHDPASLGSMSIGSTNAGALFNGVAMPPGEHWTVVDPGNAWGTKETVDALIRCIDAVYARFPDSAKTYVGHISRRTGGHISPHISHQAGRDVDVSYFLEGAHQWYAKATDANLDRARTWTFVRALITESDVELILIDSSIQKLLRDHALAIGEDRAWVDQVFQVGSKNPAPLIRHAKGHATHLHVRFFNPVAQEMGRRAYPFLAKGGSLPAPTPAYKEHIARKGDTLGSLARRYGVSVESIQQANGLRNTWIRAKVVYKIPVKGGGGGVATRPRQSGPVVIPARRLPPARSSSGPSSIPAGPQP